MAVTVQSRIDGDGVERWVVRWLGHDGEELLLPFTTQRRAESFAVELREEMAHAP